jgi:hypothetical protein
MSDTVFAQPSAINFDTGRVTYGNDSRMHVRFYRGQQLHGMQSAEAGRPIFVGVDMIEIRQPGERDVFCGLATEWHKRRFPKQWEAYQAGREYQPDGTPLDVLFPTEPEVVTNLRYFKIFTVEQLADLDDNAIARIGIGARQMVNKAIKFKESATNYAAASRMNAEIENLKSERDTLKEQLAAMQEAIARLESAQVAGEPRRGPGRPRKTEQAYEAPADEFSQLKEGASA